TEGGIPFPIDLKIKTSDTGTFQTTIPIVAGIKSIVYYAEFTGVNNSYPDWSINPSQSIPLSTVVTSIWTILVPIFIAAGVALITIPTLYMINRRFRVKRQTKVMAEAEKTFDYFSDLISLRKIYLIHKKLQKPIYEQNYNMEDFNDFTNKALINMIKGFGKGKEGYSASLDLVRFQDLFIIIDDGELTRTAFVLSKLPSNKFLKGIVRFLQFFEINNFNILKKDGELLYQRIVEGLLDYIFEISIILPYRVTMKGMNMKLNALRSQLVMTAYESAPEGYFFIADLFNKTLAKSLLPEMMIFKEISYLINKHAFILYSLKELKEKGGKIKYISTKEVKFTEPKEKLRKITEVKSEPIEEEYITPVTARIVEDYELPEPTLPTKLPPTDLEMLEEPLTEEELEEEKTPFEVIMEEKFKTAKIEEDIKPIPERVEIEKKLPPIKPISIKPTPIKPVIEPKIIKPIKITPKLIKPLPTVVKPKPILKEIKPEPKPKPVLEEITPKPKPKPSKFIQISETEKNRMDKSVIDVITQTNKLITSLDEIENYIGKAVQEITVNKKDIDDITLEILKLFEDPKVILENEIDKAKTKLKKAEKIVEKLLFYLIDIEKDLEKSDTEFSVILNDTKIIRKKLEKQSQSKVELDLQKTDEVQEKLIEIDEKISKSLEVRAKFEDRLNESAKIVEKLDDKLNNAEKKIGSSEIKQPEIKDEKSKTYELKIHCPTCSKILTEREINLLKKGFTPECPACGKILKPTDFDL
ncbi:MAG: coiled-coil domain-containing protein, partial [Promethearchaeota archaeon]